MTPRGESLLAGPRGRRLCLELVRDLDPAIHSAAFGLEYGREPPRPHLVSALDRLSARILALDLSDLDDHRILAALGQAVDSARYWQPPEEADVLAEHPVIRSALEPLSERLASDPSTQWFWEPRRAEQWAIDWRSENARPPLPKDPQHTLAKWVRDARVEEESAVRGRPGGPHASWTGHWWSIPLGLVQTVGHLPAALGLVEDSLGWEQATAIPVRGSGRTFEVRSEADWVYLCRDFPLEVTASRRHDWFRTTGRDGRWVIPDWARVAHEWDAVHLTVMAYLSSATRALQIDADTSSVIAGWDPGSTIWLTDAVAESDGPRQDWRLDGADDTWIRES